MCGIIKQVPVKIQSGARICPWERGYCRFGSREGSRKPNEFPRAEEVAERRPELTIMIVMEGAQGIEAGSKEFKPGPGRCPGGRSWERLAQTASSLSRGREQNRELAGPHR